MSEEFFNSPERADFSLQNHCFLFGEHLARYLFAAQYVQGKIVVDVATGAGYGSAILKQAGATHVVGIDYDKQAIEKKQKLVWRAKNRFPQRRLRKIRHLISCSGCHCLI